MKKKEQKERDFEQLVERQRQTIYSVCYLFANERQQADDLVQEVLLLRESINSHSNRRHTIIRTVGITLFVVIAIVLLFFDRTVFFIWLLLGLFDFLFWDIDSKQRTKSYEKLNKEMDELLNEE